MPGPRPDESARLREPPRADIESPLREIAAAPYSGEPRTFPLWQTSAAACGQAALRIARKEVIPPGTIATL